MSIIQSINAKVQAHHAGHCGCGHDKHGTEQEQEQDQHITKDMIVKDVTKRWPQTIAVFGNHKVDFCCGGAHSIDQTAHARGCQDVDALVADLNAAIR